MAIYNNYCVVFAYQSIKHKIIANLAVNFVKVQPIHKYLHVQYFRVKSLHTHSNTYKQSIFYQKRSKVNHTFWHEGIHFEDLTVA